MMISDLLRSAIVRNLSRCGKMAGNMTKGAFFMNPLTEESVTRASESGVSAVFIAPHNIDPTLGRHVRRKGMDVYLVKELFQGELWWERFPDSRPVGRDGEPLKVAAGWYHGVCPTHPGVREHLFHDFEELLDLDFVSGINLNFLRFPGYWEGARGRESLIEGCTCERCRALYGGDPVGPNWERWKAAQISDFAREVVALRDRKERRIPLGLHLVPWDDETYQRARPGALGQDLAELNGLLDYYSPMCHFGLQEQPPEWVGHVVQWTKNETGKPVMPVVQAFDVTDEEFRASISNATSVPSDGAIVFTWEFLQEQPEKSSALKTVYSA